MAKEISKLFVTLGLNDKGFSSQLKKIDKQTAALGKTMLAAGTAIVAGIGMAVKAWAQAGNEVQKMSLRTNWAAESLSELRYVAEICGTELQGFEKGTRKLNQAILDGSAGLVTYNRYFEMLGLNARELKEMKSEEAFWEVAEALAGMTNEVEQGAIAAQLFGRTGTQLLPMLAEGADGIKRLREEAHDLGIVFDKEAADAAADFVDSMQRLKESFEGVSHVIAKAAAPTIEAYAKLITKTIKSVIKLAEENEDLSNTVVNTGLSFGTTLVGMGGLLLLLPKAIQLSKGLAGGLGTLSLAIVGATAGLTLMGTGIQTLIQNHIRYEAMIEAGIKLSEEYAKAKRGEANAVWEAMEAEADSREAYVKASGMTEEQKEEQYEYIDALRRAIKTHEDYLKVLAEATAKIKEQKDALKANREEFLAMIEKIRYAYTDAAELGLTIEDITRYMLEAGRGAELMNIKWEEIGDNADLLAQRLNLDLKALAGGDLFAQAYQTYEKEIQAIENIADADRQAIDDRLAYYREKFYERERIIEEAALKEIAAVNPNVAAIIEGYNEEMGVLDERERARDIARENERIAALESQLTQEELSEAERERIRRDLEEAQDAQHERQILETRNARIAALDMEAYLENRKTLITQNLEDEKAIKETALAETKAIYQAETEAFKAMNESKIADLKRMHQLILMYQKVQGFVPPPPTPPGEGLYPPFPEGYGMSFWEEYWARLSRGEGPRAELPSEEIEKLGPIELPSYAGFEGPVPGRMGQPYPAIVHGGEIISQPGKASQTITQHFHIAQLVVREDADVEKVARQLYRMQQARF